MSTLVMGIVNVTSDSFSDGGRYLDLEAAVEHGLSLVRAGADILDIGGESTRPGAERVPVEIEQARVVPVVQALTDAGCVVSIDTMNASTAAASIAAGARIVNDVSGGLADPQMFDVVAASTADVIIGHWRGHSDAMYAEANYGDVAREVIAELLERREAAARAGIAPSRIVLDPGIGFAKRGSQNWQVLGATPQLVAAASRVLIGTSRKRFLAETLGEDVTQERRDLATAVTSVLAARAGAWAVRVHDVAATVDALRILTAWDTER